MTDGRRRLSKVSNEGVSPAAGGRTKIVYVEKVVFESVIRCVVTILIQDLIMSLH